MLLLRGRCSVTCKSSSLQTPLVVGNFLAINRHNGIYRTVGLLYIRSVLRREFPQCGALRRAHTAAAAARAS